MVPPFRNITNKLYSFLITSIQPTLQIAGPFRTRVVEAFHELAESILAIIRQQDIKRTISNKLYVLFVREVNQSTDLKSENFKSFLTHPSLLTRSEDSPPELLFQEQSFESLVR